MTRCLRLETIASDGASAGGQKRSLGSPRRGHQAGGDAGARQGGARPLARMEQVIERTKAKQSITAQAPARLDQARIDKWIRDRLVDWRDSCWRCRKPIVVGQVWTVVTNGEVSARFHQRCRDEWRVQEEVAARRAMGLDRNRCAQQDPDAVCASVPQ
jgi:hypothetical protein